MKVRTQGLIAVFLLWLCASTAQGQVLYDGSSGVTPDNAQWQWSYASLGGTASNTASGGAAILDTTSADGISAGYGKGLSFNLDASQGYTVRFDMQLISEDHSNANADKNSDGLADRAGFSALILGSDKKGVELAFWTAEIWPQSSGFLHDPAAERAFIDPTTALNRYDLRVSGSSYNLYVNNGASPILSGSLRDYSAGPSIPYSNANYLFFGDDTGSANAKVKIARIEVVTPEPGAWALFASVTLSGATLLRRRLRLRRSSAP